MKTKKKLAAVLMLALAGAFAALRSNTSEDWEARNPNRFIGLGFDCCRQLC